MVLLSLRQPLTSQKYELENKWLEQSEENRKIALEDDSQIVTTRTGRRKEIDVARFTEVFL